MTAGQRSILTKVAACALLAATSTQSALATRPRPDNSIPTKSDIVWIGVGVAAIGAAIGIGVYFAVRPHGQRITGCASSGPNGLQLVGEGDQQTYILIGETGGIKPGERIRVSGKKEKSTAGAMPQFFVDKPPKDFGACKVQPAKP
ncbi:MAG TPA: hypothetical protein VN776_13785 [Terracidiphilus sp.]|nr:hypothetical protein [Terracidiphilus sp.]